MTANSGQTTLLADKTPIKPPISQSPDLHDPQPTSTQQSSEGSRDNIVS